MAGFDFIGHEESYKLRYFLKYHIFDTNYADVAHKILFGQPINLSQARKTDRLNYRSALRQRQISLGDSSTKARSRSGRYKRKYKRRFSGYSYRRRYY